MLVLSSPSGAGKTTLSRQLLGNDSQISLSISCTTRDKRPGEKCREQLRYERHGKILHAGPAMQLGRARKDSRSITLPLVMAGHSRPKDGVASARLCPAIHALSCATVKTWMPGTRPGMTNLGGL